MGIVKTTRVFQSGNSQAVRLPKEFRLASKTIEITRRGNELILRERPAGLERAFRALASLPDDFFADGRVDPPPQRRRGL
jgi:antitoxin VapB